MLASPICQELIESTPFGVLVVDPSGRIRFANHQLHQIFGYEPRELEGQAVEILVPSSVAARHVALREEYMRSPSLRMMAHRELWGVRRDGSDVFLAIGLSPLVQEGETFVACVVLDITLMKRSERDLIRFFDLSLDMFCIANLEGYFLRVNSNFQRVLGYSERELKARPFFDFVHPDDLPATRQAVAQLTAGLPVVLFQNRYRDVHGHYHWIEWTSQAIPSEKTIFAVARDVSERVQMERELVSREQRERAILDNTTARIYVKGLDNRYQFVNQHFADCFALERGAVLGRADHELLPPALAEVLAAADRQVMESQQTVTTEETLPQPDGTHTYVSVKFPLFDDRGDVLAVAGISTDITDRVRAQQAEEQLRLARAFQERLYPAVAPNVLGLEIAGTAYPVSQMCGDFYDYVVRDDRRLVVSVGDVSGHGLGPALEMVELRIMLRMLLRDYASLEQIVDEVNRQLCSDLPEDSFISLFILELDARRRLLTYVGAGHEAYLVQADGMCESLPSTGLVLGIHTDVAYEQAPTRELSSGDLLALFTDGVTEAMNGRGELYGKQRMLALLAANRTEPCSRALARLFEDVQQFADGRAIQDDMTAILIKLL